MNFTISSFFGKEFWECIGEFESKGLVETDVYVLKKLARILREKFSVNFFAFLSKEDRYILEKRGFFILAPFNDGIERIYTSKEMVIMYEKFHYNKKILIDSMRLDGANPKNRYDEFCKLDEFLRKDVLFSFEDPDIEVSKEQYQRAKTYLEVENFIDSCKEDISLNPRERIDTISNLVNYTLDISNNYLEEKSQVVSNRILSLIQKPKTDNLT